MIAQASQWLRSLYLMTIWESRSMRLVIPFAVIVQILIGAGLVVGYGFMIANLSQFEALYLSTGLAVVSMITIGMVLAPQLISQQKLAGVYDYIWSLPVPRSSTVAAGLLINGLIALPGLVITLVVAAWRWDLSFTLSWVLIPAIVMTLLCAASFGFALAHGIKDAMITGLITQVLVFFILLFSPLAFPSERLPGWLASMHDWLPFEHCANVVRAGLTEGIATNVGQSFVVLGAWVLLSWLVLIWVIGRRD